jgi:hypothetical protein
LLILLFALRRRVPARAAAAGLVTMAVGLFATSLLNQFLISRNYDGRDFHEAGDRLSSAGNIAGILSVARNLLGETWYVLVSTLGVVGLLVVAHGRRAVRRTVQARADAPDAVLGLLLAATAALLAVSALSLATITRPDMVIYGRYVEVAVPPLLAVGIARLVPTLSASRLRTVAVVTLVLTASVAALRAGADVPGTASRWNVASLPFVTRNLVASSLVGAACSAAVALGVLVTIARQVPRAVAPALLLLFLPTTAYVLRHEVVSGQRATYPPGWKSPEQATQRVGASVLAYDQGHEDVFAMYTYQWFLPHTRMELTSARAPLPSVPYVLSSRDWGARHRDLRPRPLWRDSIRDQTLWEVPS